MKYLPFILICLLCAVVLGFALWVGFSILVIFGHMLAA